MKQDFTVVNGQSYDNETGMPIAGKPAQSPAKKGTEAAGASRGVDAARVTTANTERSKTLRRTALKKPAAAQATPVAATPANQVTPRTPRRRVSDIARHPSVQKHAPAPVAPVKSSDIAPRTHPHVVKANVHMAQKRAAVAPAPSHGAPKNAKEAEISKAMASAPSKKEQTVAHKRQSTKGRKKAIKITAIIVSILIVLAVIAWFLLPTLLMKLAGFQTGVPATLPQFTPEGYSLSFPIKSDNNTVTSTFRAAGNSSFTLSQAKSAWDSDAVRAMVEKQSNGQFLTAVDRGLTVYTYGGNAAWVNKGILYTISGEPPLSSDTIMDIAQSL
jgi:cation transport ATPase